MIQLIKYRHYNAYHLVLESIFDKLEENEDDRGGFYKYFDIEFNLFVKIFSLGFSFHSFHLKIFGFEFNKIKNCKPTFRFMNKVDYGFRFSIGFIYWAIFNISIFAWDYDGIEIELFGNSARINFRI